MAAITLFPSCTQTGKHNSVENPTEQVKVNPIIKKPGSSFSDTLVINQESAVFYLPDSAQMLKIKAVNTKNIYDNLVHDCHFQMQNATNIITKYWPKVKIIRAQNVRYLTFIKLDKTRLTIDLDQKNDICGIFLFDQKKNPALADMPNIDTILRLYFK
ncbi:MAG: hypothetical protein KGM98_15785 [Bacteroidota bacterium]|nr:hypothetical protein [Bacteroidota bacterium]